MEQGMTPPEIDDDHIDGCDIDFRKHADDPQTAELRLLFPDGTADPELAQAYRDLAALDA